MPETNFADIRGTRGRGGRYPGFSGGLTSQNSGNAIAVGPTLTNQAAVYGQGPVKRTPNDPRQLEAAPAEEPKATGGIAKTAAQLLLPSAISAGATAVKALSNGVSAAGALNKAGSSLVSSNFGLDSLGQALGMGATKTGGNIAANAASGLSKAKVPGSVSSVGQTASGFSSALSNSVIPGVSTFAADLIGGKGVERAAVDGVGAAAGAAIGSIGGPVGSFVGGFIGSNLGRWLGIGGSKQTNAGAGGSFSATDPATDSWWDMKKGNSAQNLEILKQLSGNVRSYVSDYNTKNSGTPISGQITGLSYGNRDPWIYTYNGQTYKGKAGDPNALQESILKNLTSGASANYQSQIANKFAS
jgi:hypothetical protein